AVLLALRLVGSAEAGESSAHGDSDTAGRGMCVGYRAFGTSLAFLEDKASGKALLVTDFVGADHEGWVLVYMLPEGAIVTKFKVGRIQVTRPLFGPEVQAHEDADGDRVEDVLVAVGDDQHHLTRPVVLMSSKTGASLREFRPEPGEIDFGQH